jgi:hypothetical protein
MRIVATTTALILTPMPIGVAYSRNHDTITSREEWKQQIERG